LTTPPAPDLKYILGDTDSPAFHVGGAVGLGVYSLHGFGGGSGPVIGSGASVNVSKDRFAVGVSWTEFNQSSQSGSWSGFHH